LLLQFIAGSKNPAYAQGISHFFDFVNHHRLEHTKELLSADEIRSLQDVAFESGFSSQFAFSTRFNKETKLTPSQFLRRKK